MPAEDTAVYQCWKKSRYFRLYFIERQAFQAKGVKLKCTACRLFRAPARKIIQGKLINKLRMKI